MSNFKIGEKVVCIGVNDIDIHTNEKTEHPKIKDIVTISFIASDGWLCFEEYGFVIEYEPYNFRKLDYAHTERICAEIIESLKVEEFQYN